MSKMSKPKLKIKKLRKHTLLPYLFDISTFLWFNFNFLLTKGC